MKVEALVQYLPIIAIFAIMIGMTVWQSKKQKKRMQELNDSLKIGVKVRTAGGFLGTVVGITEDTVYVELNPDKVKVELLKGAVAPMDEQPVPVQQPVQEEAQEPEQEENTDTEE